MFLLLRYYRRFTSLFYFFFGPSHPLTLQGFDAMLTDPMVPTGSLIARKLGEFRYTGITCVYVHLQFLTSHL